MQSAAISVENQSEQLPAKKIPSFINFCDVMDGSSESVTLLQIFTSSRPVGLRWRISNNPNCRIHSTSDHFPISYSCSLVLRYIPMASSFMWYIKGVTHNTSRVFLLGYTEMEFLEWRGAGHIMWWGQIGLQLSCLSVNMTDLAQL